MEPLYIKEREDTPLVVLDKLNSIFEIKGISMPENVNEFYSGIITWIEEYSKDPNQETVFDFRLDYYNSASAKQIFEIFHTLGKIIDIDKEVIIRWHYQHDDEEMEDAGKAFASICKVSFKLIPCQ